MENFKNEALRDHINLIHSYSQENLKKFIYKAGLVVVENFEKDQEGSLRLLYRIIESFKTLQRQKSEIDEKKFELYLKLVQKLENSIDFSKYEDPVTEETPKVTSKPTEPSKYWISPEQFYEKLTDQNQIYLQCGILLLNNAKTVNSSNLYYISENKDQTFRSVFKSLVKENPEMNSTIYLFDESSGMSIINENKEINEAIDTNLPQSPIFKGLIQFIELNYPQLEVRLLAGGLNYFSQKFGDGLKIIGSNETSVDSKSKREAHESFEISKSLLASHSYNRMNPVINNKVERQEHVPVKKIDYPKVDKLLENSRKSIRKSDSTRMNSIEIITSNSPVSENPPSNNMKPIRQPIVDRSTKPKFSSRTDEDVEVIKMKSIIPAVDRSLKPSLDKVQPLPNRTLKRQNSLPELAKTNVSDTIDKFNRIDLNKFDVDRNQLASFSAEYSTHNELGRTGLKNLGNTCYMNAIIQCLAHCKAFVEMMTNKKAILSKVPPNESLMMNFYHLIGALTNSYYASIYPTKFKSCIDKVIPMFYGYEQQDAAEFLMFLLNRLHEEINKPLDKVVSTNSVIRNIECEKKTNCSIVLDYFQMFTRNTLYCLNCEQKIYRYEPTLYLSLPIPNGAKHLNDCILKFSEEERLSAPSKCDLCKQISERSIKADIIYLPRYIILHFKRFTSINKMTSFIDFPLTTNFSSLMPEVVDLETEKRTKNLVYNLVGITNHSGTLHHGHYKSFCKLDNRWFCYDDNIVTRTSEPYIKTNDAYILFYEKSC